MNRIGCLLGGLVCGLLFAVPTLPALEPALPAALGKNTHVLFQGDSITDGNRGRNADPNHILGHGYAFIIAAKFGGGFPEQKLSFTNRGVSGNTVLDLEKRWPKDALELKPDLLSILIGVNDVGKKVPHDQFEQTYDKLLTDTKAAIPHIKFVLGEPFTLPGNQKKEPWDAWVADITARQAIVAKLAKKHDAALVRFQQAFDEAVKRAPAEYWIWDSVHPTYNGHQIMAEAWIRDVNQHWPAVPR